ncbi:uncharacterized protein [Rutidosis leptorrhynchoides]|uniref:uncharacterized protein n=1 Tax=Rutidosis leptorrhynchoides TaxID=125765 RepID=UPI003A9A134F
MRLGYYWPLMYRDATEWVETKPLKTISGKQICNFVWENIVCRFGIPNEIVSDNGTQFEGNPFSIKEILRLCRRGWIDELPNVMWAHRTTPKGATNETPFSLVYGSEAVIPAEINVSTMRIASFDKSSNSEELRENLNLVEECREMAKNEARRAEDTGKLGPKWEGQYKVIGVSDTGAYRLASLDGRGRWDHSPKVANGEWVSVRVGHKLGRIFLFIPSERSLAIFRGMEGGTYIS